MRINTGYEHRRGRIEILPLIDVVFLLLVFFIYAMISMTVYSGVRVDLPDVRGEESTPDAFVITITAGNALFVGEDRVSVDEAVSKASVASRAEQKPVIVSGDKESDLGISVELLSKLRNLQVEAVTFRVEQEQ